MPCRDNRNIQGNLFNHRIRDSRDNPDNPGSPLIRRSRCSRRIPANRNTRGSLANRNTRGSQGSRSIQASQDYRHTPDSSPDSRNIRGSLCSLHIRCRRRPDHLQVREVHFSRGSRTTQISLIIPINPITPISPLSRRSILATVNRPCHQMERQVSRIRQRD